MNRHRIIRAVLAITLPLSGYTTLFAATTTSEDVRESEVRQEQIRAQTQVIGGQIDSIILDFQKNGLNEGQDIDTLKGIRSVLGQLSDKQMAQVVQLLQQARNSGDEGKTRQTVAAAVRGQQDVIANLRALLTTYRQQQAMYQLAAKFSQLAERQEQNLGATIEVVTQAGGKKLDQMDAASRDSVGVQATQQTGIKDDTAAALSELKAVMGQGEGKMAQRLAAAAKLAIDQNLVTTQTSAATDLGAGNLYNSAKLQRTSREALRDIARLVTVLEDDTTRLKAASEQIGKAIEEQKKLQNETSQAKNDKQKATDADKQQAKLVDKTNSTRKDVEDLAPNVTEKLKAAEDKMQESRLVLRNTKTDDAAKKQTEAVDALAKAKEEIDKQIATAELVKADPKDNLEKAKELLEKVQAMKKEQDALKKETASNPAKKEDNAKKQEDLQKRAEQAQQQAQADNPQAAKPLNEAAKEMDKAADQIKEQQPAQKPEGAQQKASDNLAKAEDAIKKQVEDLEKKAEELAKVEELQKKVTELIVAEQGIEAKTAKAAATKQPAPALPDSQKDTAAKTSSVKEEAASVSPEASAALGDAKQNMDGAKSKLDKTDYPGAKEPEKEAVADLTKAKDLLDKKANELKEELGQQPNANEQMAAAEAAINKALEETQQAGQQMEQAAQPKNLQEEQQKLANEMKAKADAAPQDPDLKAAQQAAQEAASKLGENKPAEASKAMEKAQAAMEKAEAGKPEAGKPEAGKPEAGKPEAGKPEAAQAEAGKPEAGKPEAGKPEAGKPEAGKPEAGQAGKPEAGAPGAPGAPKPSAQQAELKKQADAMAAAQAAQQAAQQAMQDAGKQMEQTAQELAKANAENSAALPQSVQQAMQQATQDLQNAAAQAAAQQQAPAQQSNQAAQQALAQAKAAMAMAAQAGKPGQPGPPGPPGPPMPGKGPPGPMANQPPPPEGTGDVHDGSPPGQAPGTVAAVGGKAAYINLPQRDRQAIQQSQGDKVPQEYGPMVEQYLRNLADDQAK